MADYVVHGAERRYNGWTAYIKKRIRENKNFISFIGGPTGSGKTYSALKICEVLDDDFNVDRIVFDGLELMRLLNEGNIKSGSCILFEEAGVAMSNRNWYSTLNKMLNYLMQTFRHRNIVLIFTSPYMDFIDAGTRKLIHAEIMTDGIDYEKKVCRLKPMLIQYNSRYNKYYYKYLKMKIGGNSVKIKRWSVGLASPELIKAYEEKKRRFTDKLNEDILVELGGKKKKELKTIYKWKCNNCNNITEAPIAKPTTCKYCKRLYYKHGDFLGKEEIEA